MTLVVRDLLEQARNLNRTAGGAHISLEQMDPVFTVVGTEDDLVRVFSNLLANALRHTPADGNI
jgi:signal transduction histidine kinase